MQARGLWLLTIVNGLVRSALLRTSCQYFEKKAARATSKKFRLVTSVNLVRASDALLSYVADPPRGFASYLEKVMKRQWGSRRDTNTLLVLCTGPRWFLNNNSFQDRMS